MTIASWCAASTWSSATRSRRRSRRAASSPRRRRSTCPTWQLPIRRTASRRVLDSSSSAKAMTARRCGSPSARELRSMADKEKDGGKAAKPAPKVDKSPEAQARAEKAAAAEQKAAAKKAAAEAGDKKPREPEERVTPRLRTQFDQVIRKAMIEKFGYKNAMQVPRLDKIVLNMGIGEGVADRKKVEQAADALTAIVGQKAVITRSRKSIANYKLRDGQAIGCKVTLRKTRMYEFLD